MSWNKKKKKKRKRKFNLERAIAGYLERYETSRGHLRFLMLRRARKYEADLAEVEPELDARLDRLEEVGLLDDTRFAESMVRRGRRQGQSSRLIRSKLFQKRVPRDVIDQVLRDDNGDLRAAASYVRKKRMGAYRRKESTPELRQKELARLARRGFTYQIARKVLDLSREELEEIEG